MASHSTIRAASNADRRSQTQQHPDRTRVSTSAPTDQPKSNTRHGFGLNASDRRNERVGPFEPSERPSAWHNKTRDSVKDGPSRVRSGKYTSQEGSHGYSSWNPQASVTTSTTAPLATRISVPQTASSALKYLQPQSFTGLSPRDQERALVDDLLFVFMGFEGQYVRFASSYDPREEKDRLTGPELRILSGLDPSLHGLAHSMLKVAKFYIALEAFIEVQSREEFGTVNHALCAAIRRLLKDYLTLIAQLEHQLLTNDDFTLHILNLHMKPSSEMLLQLYHLAQEILKKNSILEEDADDSDDLEDVDNIIEQLREGGDGGDVATRKVCKGGNVLGLITRRRSSMSGDPNAHTLLNSLLREASKPYMTMLNEWLHHGGIRDPHAEFLIREQKSIRREGLEQDYTDEYWEKRYTVREGDVPPQLDSVKDKVLLAGKYLNVVRECGGVDVSTEVKHVPTSFDDPRFLENVNNAYAHANSSLLTLLLTTHSLPARLRSLKHYFFLDRSDFFSYFLELGTSELRKSAKAVNVGKLQSLLDIVLRQPGSVAAEDPFKEDVKVQMNEVSLTNWLMRIVNVTGLDQDAVNTNMANILAPAAPPSATEDKDINGFEALVFDYAVPFPLSLVISRVTLTRYQLLFRYLLSLRHLETLLVESWVEHSKISSWRHRSSNPKIENWKRRAWTLRARMLVFVQQLLYFCTSEVIEPNWQSLMERLNERSTEGNPSKDSSRSAKRTVDELMQDHVDFLATCLKECMLTNSKLLRINSKVMTTCTTFANYTSSLSRHLAAADADLSQQPSQASKQPPSKPQHSRDLSTQPSYDPARLDKIMDTLQKYEDHFNRHLKILLDALNYLAATETVVFLGLCARLSTANEGAGSRPVGAEEVP